MCMIVKIDKLSHEMRGITKIDKLSHEMRGITKIDNKITFIDNTLPGEVVNIKITKQKKNINEGRVISILEESKDREVPTCPYYNECGGCNISHINYEKSLLYKKEIVKDIRKLAEEAKVAIRSIRRDAMDEAKEMQKKSEITEDDLKNEENEIQKLTDKKVEEIDSMLASKEREVMSI